MYLLQKKHFDILREPGDKDYNKSVSMDENLNSAKKNKTTTTVIIFNSTLKRVSGAKLK